MTSSTEKSEWMPVAVPPPPYSIVQLSFDDGSIRRAVWNGKMWWGYDERVRRACPLHPVSWRMWDDAPARVTRFAGPLSERAQVRANN
jgi:hypothetical protein